jgi:hypothetical protein
MTPIVKKESSPDLPFNPLFPQKTTGGPTGTTFFLFELLMNDGTVIEAYVVINIKYRQEQSIEYRTWVDARTDKPVPMDEIVGWRDPFTCNDAQRAIIEYFRDPGIMTRQKLADAKSRHMYMGKDNETVACEFCVAYYNEASSRNR